MHNLAVLATLLCAEEELCILKVEDLQSRQGVIHFKVKGQAREESFCAGARAAVERELS